LTNQFFIAILSPMTIKTHHRILMTGAAGSLGTAMRPRLTANCEVLRLSDRLGVPPANANEEVSLAELGDEAAVLALLKGVNAVVHFGGVSVEGPFAPILQANIIGMYNLYEAARKQGTQRIIFASSNHATGFYQQSETITPNAVPRPDGNYGVSKAFGENISRFYFDRYGIETACLRIGSCFPEPKDRRMLASWLSFDDLYRLLTACLTTPSLGHSVIYGMSKNSVTWWDNSAANHVGYVPQDSADSFREAIYAKTATPDVRDPVVKFQGGAYVAMGPYASVNG
jgi:uronate dehydrogenase